MRYHLRYSKWNAKNAITGLNRVAFFYRYRFIGQSRLSEPLLRGGTGVELCRRNLAVDVEQSLQIDNRACISREIVGRAAGSGGTSRKSL
uniref:Uncharacterized protein n=1 Tax=Paenibacillus athensensis TaxID=1967502 RepID=A0A4Y8Q114_9BACL